MHVKIFILGKIEFRGLTTISISHDPVSHHVNIIIISSTDILLLLLSLLLL